MTKEMKRRAYKVWMRTDIADEKTWPVIRVVSACGYLGAQVRALHQWPHRVVVHVEKVLYNPRHRP